MIVDKTIMFVVMAFLDPNREKEGEMANRMRSFRNVLQTKSGLVKTFVLKEKDGKTLVGVSMWTDEARTRMQWRAFIHQLNLRRRTDREIVYP